MGEVLEANEVDTTAEAQARIETTPPADQLLNFTDGPMGLGLYHASYDKNGHTNMYVAGYIADGQNGRVTYYLCSHRIPHDAPKPDLNPQLNAIDKAYTAEKSRLDSLSAAERHTIDEAQRKINAHLYKSGWDGVDPIKVESIPEDLKGDWDLVKDCQTFFDQERWAGIHDDIYSDY